MSYGFIKYVTKWLQATQLLSSLNSLDFIKLAQNFWSIIIISFHPNNVLIMSIVIIMHKFLIPLPKLQHWFPQYLLGGTKESRYDFKLANGHVILYFLLILNDVLVNNSLFHFIYIILFVQNFSHYLLICQTGIFKPL